MNNFIKKLKISGILLLSAFAIAACGKDGPESWPQAYIDYLAHDSDIAGQNGYVLIYIDADEIPELVEIGADEATGCRIINFSDGAAHVTQLNRLYFSYIERENLLCNSEGNMDYYYDERRGLRESIKQRVRHLPGKSRLCLQRMVFRR